MTGPPIISSSKTETLGFEFDTARGAEENMLPDVDRVEAGTEPKILADEADELKLEDDDGIAGELPSKSSIPRRSMEG